jgi:diguanylate cyclase (GGDEF)-like protein/PAS domain S-box-containing protein
MSENLIIIGVALVVILLLLFGLMQTAKKLKQANAALAADQARFKDFSDNEHVWFWETDKDLKITHLSSQLQKIIGNLTKIYMGSPCHKAFGSHMVKPDQRGVFAMYLESKKGFTDLEASWKSSTGNMYALLLSGKPVLDSKGEFTGFRGTIQDVTEKKQLKSVVNKIVIPEGRVLVVTRSIFEEHLKRAIFRAKDRGQYTVMCYLDLDNFKPVREIAGDKACENYLEGLTATIQTKVRSRDSLTKITGEKFCLILENCPLDKAAVIANGLIMDIASYDFIWESEKFDITASIGLIIIDGEIMKTNELIALGNKACLEAKALGGNQVYIPQLA